MCDIEFERSKFYSLSEFFDLITINEIKLVNSTPCRNGDRVLIHCNDIFAEISQDLLDEIITLNHSDKINNINFKKCCCSEMIEG